jgi:phosphate/sulfate permease
MDWKKTLATVAPALATALGGPLAGVAVSMATKALGLPESTQEALQAAVVGGGADTLLKLKEADNQFTLEMERLGVDVLRIDAGDRADARALAKDKGIWIQAVLTALFCGLFALLLNQIFSGQEVVHSTMRDIANFLLGTLTGILIQQMNFWFGSSEGSKRKTQQGVAKP